MQRPTGVTILAVLSFIGAAFFLLASLAMFIGGGMLSQMGGSAGMGTMLGALGAFAGVILLAFTAYLLAQGIGLFKLKNWGRIMTIICIGLGLLSAAMGVFSSLSPMQLGHLIGQLIVVAIDVWILVYLFKPHVKQAFGA